MNKDELSNDMLNAVVGGTYKESCDDLAMLYRTGVLTPEMMKQISSDEYVKLAWEKVGVTIEEKSNTPNIYKDMNGNIISHADAVAILGDYLDRLSSPQ